MLPRLLKNWKLWEVLQKMVSKKTFFLMHRPWQHKLISWSHVRELWVAELTETTSLRRTIYIPFLENITSDLEIRIFFADLQKKMMKITCLLHPIFQNLDAVSLQIFLKTPPPNYVEVLCRMALRCFCAKLSKTAISVCTYLWELNTQLILGMYQKWSV